MSAEQLRQLLTRRTNTNLSVEQYVAIAAAQILQEKQQQQHQLQQQQHQVYQRAPLASSTALELLNSSPASLKNELTYIVADLKRSSHVKSWGICFSQFNDNLNQMVIGETKTIMTEHSVSCYLISGRNHALDANQVYDNSMNYTNQSTRSYQQRIKHYAASKSYLHSANQSLLMPGDIILAIDGFKPSEFQSLANFTKYLRSSLHFSLVLLRHPKAMTAALAFVPTTFPLTPKLPNIPYRAAEAAHQVWKQVLLDQFTSGTPSPTSIVRQVTPDDSKALSAAASHLQNAGLPMQQSRIPLLNSDSRRRFYLQSVLARMSRPTLSMPAPSPSMKQPCKPPAPSLAQHPTAYPDYWKNPFFRENDKEISYYDNWEYSPEDGYRASLFLPTINDFNSWLISRKRKWRTKFKVYKHLDDMEDNDEEAMERGSCNVGIDFWSNQGFESFDAWLLYRKESWRTNYSKYRNKRQRIHRECDEVVHLNSPSSEELNHWLRIRKNQWKVLRRKRQRQRQEASEPSVQTANRTLDPVTSESTNKRAMVVTPEKPAPRSVLASKSKTKDMDMACIDDILEEEERKRKKRAERPPVDISFLFDSSKGAPDDIVVHCFEYLERKEHGKLLCISKETSEGLKKRDFLWQQLCPSHWILPRRPRKPWHEIYISRLRREQTDCQKRWDDLILKCSAVLVKGDHLHKIEKLISKGEEDFGFDAKYVSPVVCERNSLLNLAVIHRRHKVVRWLVDEKKTDIESFDRGHFTPLLNAAWAGDKPMVRYLLQRGADRSKIGFGHYSKALAHPDFKGLTAEGWARKKGHESIAELIRLGL